jgi:hypothetical protein
MSQSASSTAKAPAAHYPVETGDNNFYANFLAPLEGSAVKRGGRRDVKASVSGVSVQKLRHLELMLRNPWDVMIARATGYPTPGVRRILVPKSAAFLIQKMLIMKGVIATSAPRTSFISTTHSRPSEAISPRFANTGKRIFGPRCTRRLPVGSSVPSKSIFAKSMTRSARPRVSLQAGP